MTCIKQNAELNETSSLSRATTNAFPEPSSWSSPARTHRRVDRSRCVTLPEGWRPPVKPTPVPPAPVAGRVTSVDLIGGKKYATINVGTTENVQKGMRFDVINRESGEFLGFLTIDRVEPQRSHRLRRRHQDQQDRQRRRRSRPVATFSLSGRLAEGPRSLQVQESHHEPNLEVATLSSGQAEQQHLHCAWSLPRPSLTLPWRLCSSSAMRAKDVLGVLWSGRLIVNFRRQESPALRGCRYNFQGPAIASPGTVSLIAPPDHPHRSLPACWTASCALVAVPAKPGSTP